MALETALKRFGFVTVMEPKFTVLKRSTVEGESWVADDTHDSFKIDSLRISNITQEGPTKEARGGLYATTQLRHGKTMRLEMEDVVGRIEVLQHIMGADVGESKIRITDKFANPLKIEGRTFVIDANTGNKEWIKITIHQFLPDSIFEQTMEAEGDFGAMNIGGEIIPDECGTFYEIELDEGIDCPTVIEEEEEEETPAA